MKRADISGGCIGILIGLYALWQALHMPADVVMKIGPGFFPGILAGLLILFSLILVINAFAGRSKGELTPLKLSDPGVRRGLITLLATIIFCVLLKPLGFIPTSLAFLVLMAVVMGRRKPLTLIAAPAIITFSIWLIFEKLLQLSLPPGVLAGLPGL